MSKRVSEYEVDYMGNIIEVLPRPRTSYPPVPTQPLDSLPLDDVEYDLEKLEKLDYEEVENS